MAGLWIVAPEEFAGAFNVSRETIARLETYAGLLAQWQKAVNLVSPATLSEVWPRHFADSAQLARLAPPAARTWVDLGSGAGFPGLVVAIMLAETGQVRVTLIDSDQRKCAFLREAARQTCIAVDILADRIETAATRFTVAPPDVVSARALAPLGRLLRLARPFCAPHTVCLFLKGRDAAAEVEAARREWEFDAELVPSQVRNAAAPGSATDGKVVVIRGLRRREVGSDCPSRSF